MVKMTSVAFIKVVAKDFGRQLVIGMTSYQLHDDYPAQTHPFAR